MRNDLVKGTAVNTVETFHLFSLHFPPECRKAYRGFLIPLRFMICISSTSFLSPFLADIVGNTGYGVQTLKILS